MRCNPRARPAPWLSPNTTIVVRFAISSADEISAITPRQQSRRATRPTRRTAPQNQPDPPPAPPPHTPPPPPPPPPPPHPPPLSRFLAVLDGDANSIGGTLRDSEGAV